MTFSKYYAAIHTYCPQCDWTGDANDIYCLRCGTKLERSPKKSNTKTTIEKTSVTPITTSQKVDSPWNAMLWSINNFISNPENIRFSIATVLITVIAISMESTIAGLLGQYLITQPFNNISFSSPQFFIHLLLIMGIILIPVLAIRMITSMNSTTTGNFQIKKKK